MSGLFNFPIIAFACRFDLDFGLIWLLEDFLDRLRANARTVTYGCTPKAAKNLPIKHWMAEG